MWYTSAPYHNVHCRGRQATPTISKSEEPDDFRRRCHRLVECLHPTLAQLRLPGLPVLGFVLHVRVHLAYSVAELLANTEVSGLAGRAGARDVSVALATYLLGRTEKGRRNIGCLVLGILVRGRQRKIDRPLSADTILYEDHELACLQEFPPITTAQPVSAATSLSRPPSYHE